MKLGIRMVLCVLLICAALTMAVFTALGFAPGRTGEPESGRENRYVLGEADGNIAVYSSADPNEPVTVTNIELAGLREADRAEIRAGLIVGTESELLQLLEDLGS